MSLYIKETGKNIEETLLFLHGDGFAGWMWDEQVKSFNDYHCIVVDLPGHGKSSDAKSLTIENTAETIINLIHDQAHDKKAHLVGISMGAQVIVQILSTAPEVIDHAMISGTLVRTTPPTINFLKHLNHLIEIYTPVKNNSLYIKSYIRSYNIPKNLYNKFKESTYIIKQDSLHKIIRDNMLFKMPEGLGNVYVPVLVMTGEKDYEIIKKSAKKLVNVLPNSKNAYALKVGHIWNMENPELFNNALRAWINDKTLPIDIKLVH
ncbi:MAG: alpha/beta fold hydrolase [Methanobacterium sp.]